ncbi:putative cytoplasm protein [Papiliotrema laurentii]|uniref:RING-type E3 ubiquitin transferase n=1 Tax=Papiliotrema laurentii TaxID=5418 RepID=A0AAD9L8L6_PAPLA|nr:putative cytoplasm protein [Papiliotrema laurentii]
MSRRRAFDTSLTNAEPKTRSTPVQSKRRQSASGSKSALPPRVPPPDPAHTSAHVPTEPSEEDAVSAGPVGHPATESAAPSEMGDTDDNVCIICAEPVTYWSVGVCGHKTCHVCAVRLRTFYKKYECTFCKTITPSLYFSRSPSVTFPTEHHLPPSPANRIAAAQAGADKLEKGKVWYEGLTLPGTLDVERFEFSDKKLGVVFEDEELIEQTLLLLRFNCPATDCDHMAVSWDHLEKHTLGTHGKVICRVCRSQLSRFAHEQTLYPPHLLALHDPSRLKRHQRPPKPKGDEIELVKSWDAPHPVCEFCHLAFFGPDELFAHMRKTHEECFVCKNLGEPHVYFKDYEKLESHFHADHYPCMQQSCLEQKFVVFPNEMDLRAHLVSAHGENMSARDRAQARQLPIEFQSHADSRRGGSSRHEAHSGGRGFTMNRAPQAQTLSSAPAMTAEQAAQQRRQIQTDRQEESRRRKGFETGLTDSRREQTSLANPDAGGSRSGYNTPREDVDDATAGRHAALLARMGMLVNDSSTKLQSFRAAVRQYRNNESGARDMVDTIYNVLDQDVDATTGVVREIASLFESEGDKDKRGAVLEALNGFRIEQREQFPALNHPGGQGGQWAGITSGKILNAKRATHTNGQNASRAVWDRVEAAAGSSAPRPRATAGANGRYVPGATGLTASSAFPALGGPAPSAGPSNKSSTHSTPWASGGAGSSNKAPPALTGPIIRSVNYPTPAAAKPKPLNNAAFPSLPTSSGKGLTKEERQALFNKPNPREESIRRITGAGPPPPPIANGWGGGSSSSGSLENSVQDLSVSGGAGGDSGSTGGKKKGKQKQLLFTVSARPS